jgi:multimeric flavodoxin WrbA
VRAIGFNASPRKRANTATVVEAVLRGAAAKGAETQLVNLNRLNMKCCQGCDGCKKDLGHCVQKDDLSPLLEELPGFDAIVMGTPIYWFHVNAQFKTLIDRLYCFYGFDTDAETGDTKETIVFPEGKKFVVVTSRGDPEDKPMVPQLYDYHHETCDSDYGRLWLYRCPAGSSPPYPQRVYRRHRRSVWRQSGSRRSGAEFQVP